MECRNFIFLLVSSISSFTCFSQGEIPVDMYTGQPSISVPIWNVRDHDLEIPIMMSNNPNGTQSESYFGQGWGLNLAGSIQRELRGLPDDFGYGDNRKGWLYTNSSGVTNATDIGNFNATASEATNNAKLTSLGYLADSEPDIFYFNFGGYSGSFVFDNTLTLRTIPYRDLKIEFTPTSGTDKKILSFKITTNVGFIYTFSSVCAAYKRTTKNAQLNRVPFFNTEYEMYKTKVSFTTQWKLTRIDSPTGAYVTFSYVSLNNVPTLSTRDITVGVYKDKIAYLPGSTDLSINSVYAIIDSVTEIHISSVVASSGSKAEMTYDTGSKTLSRITISDSRRGATPALSFVKEFAFGYMTVPYKSSLYSDVHYTRQFLSSITERSGCDDRPPYKFKYFGYDVDEGSTALSTSSTDFWGFNNGVENSTSIPKLYIYPAEPLTERYRIHPIPGYVGQEIILDGADRRPSAGPAMQAALHQIEYPQGGRTTFNYELNDYLDARTNQTVAAGGLRINRVTYYDGINPSVVEKYFEYKTADGKSSGRLISKPVFSLPTFKWKNPDLPYSTNPADDKTYASLIGDNIWKFLTVRTDTDISSNVYTHGNIVGYQVVTVKRPGSGSVKFEYNQPGVYGEVTATIDGTTWDATVNRYARSSTSTSMGVVDAGGAWSFPNSPNPDFDYQRGLLWKKSEYNEAGKLVRLTTNTYRDLFKTGSTPTKIWGLRYDKYALCDDITTSNIIYFYGKYFLLGDVDRVLKKEEVTLYDANEVGSTKFVTETTEYIMSPTHKLLSEVKRTMADGTIYTTQIKYPKDYTNITSNAENAVLMLSNLQNYNNFRHGLPIETIQTVKNGIAPTRVVSGSLVKFDPYTFSKPLMESQWTLRTKSSIRIDSFKVSSVLLNGTYKFDFDTRYEKEVAIISYDALGNPKSLKNVIGRTKATTGYAYNNSLPIVQASNVAEGQFAFSDFEVTTGNEFTTSSNFYGTGRTGVNAIHPSAKLSKVITKANVGRYILSFWIKSNASVNFIALVKNAGGTITHFTSPTISVNSTGGADYRYVQQIIPITAVPQVDTNFLFELQAQGLTTPGASSSSLLPVIDDVFLFPENADITSFTYDIPYGTASVTSGNGSAVHTLYDKIGRVRYVYNKDKDIVQKNTYPGDIIELVADFQLPSTVHPSEPTTFVANNEPCLTGLTYEWDFGNGYISGTRVQTYTYTTTGDKTVRLRVTHPLYGTKEATKLLTVSPLPLIVAICGKGVKQFSASTGVVATYSCSNISTTPPAYSVIFQASILNPEIDGGSFQWQIRNTGTTGWIPIVTSPPDKYTSQKITGNTPSFEVRCIVIGDGLTGTTDVMSVIVTP